MIALDQVQQQLGDRSFVRTIDVVPRGHIRIMTGLLYPDGSSVDVFIVNDTTASPTGGQPVQPLRLSDLGQTVAWLLDVGVRPWLSKKRQAFVEDVLRLYDVRQGGGELTLDARPGEDLAVGILRLAQACIRVADLTFTRRASLQSPFSDDVEEVLADAELGFDVGAELMGRKGTTVRVDYLVTGQTRRSAVLALSALNAQSAHHSANEIFRKWYDLDVPGRDHENVTVYDDRQPFHREEDLERLQDFSAVIPFSEKQTLIEVLAA
ncbi:MAG TPA: DUF1828 domain-containing protein [Haliangium sp.]|nr:DUF1828 domain-containing protein [Haliangium sp.]